MATIKDQNKQVEAMKTLTFCHGKNQCDISEL
jgi:hypothetical protein